MEIKLTESEVKRRLEAGGDPVALSIEHWMENAAYFLVHGEMPIFFDSRYRCALCLTHQPDRWHPDKCSECPLYKAGYGCLRADSPYTAVGSSPSFETAMAMVEALRKCLEKELPKARFYIEGGEGDTLLYLKEDVGGNICLRAADKYGFNWFILRVGQDGIIELDSGVDDQLGFKLDSEGRVVVV